MILAPRNPVQRSAGSLNPGTRQSMLTFCWKIKKLVFAVGFPQPRYSWAVRVVKGRPSATSRTDGEQGSSSCTRPGSSGDASRRTRVLVVVPSFLPELGGLETSVYETTRRIATRNNIDITVLTTDRSGRLPRKEEFEGFTVMRCRSYPKSRDYYLAPALYRTIVRSNFDLIHIQSIHTAVPIIAMMAAKRLRRPYVVTFHTGGHSSGIRHRLRYIQWRMLAPLLRDAALLVAVSRFEQRMFQRICRLESSRFRLVNNGGDLPPSALQSEAVRGRIVSSGRLERYKGHQRVIEALPIVKQSIPDASLQILGSGSYERHLRSLIEDLHLEDSVTIESVAPSNRQRMAELLGEASVVAALSEYEGHPVAVMEALTLGIPTVGLNTAGIGDLVEDGLVEGVPKDASAPAIAQALIATLGRGGRVSATANLATWDTAAENLACLYTDVIAAVNSMDARE